MKILILEGGNELSKAIILELVEVLGEIHCAADGEAALRIARQKQLDLIVLDWTLPEESGLSVLKKLRDHNILIPILMLTDEPSLENIIASISSGADDCIIKPIDYRLFMPKIKSVVRRREWNRCVEISYAHMRVNLETHKVWSGDKEIQLSVKEYDLLVYFIRNAEQVLTLTMVQENVWYGTSNISNCIRVYINYLRNKIDIYSDMKLIHSVRGIGYILSVDDPSQLGMQPHAIGSEGLSDPKSESPLYPESDQELLYLGA